MKKLELLGPGNGGSNAAIASLLGVYPWLKQICGDQEISVLVVHPPEDIADESIHSECAMGFNTDGRIYLVKKGEIVKEVSWDDVREHRKQKNLPGSWRNSPQTELTGDEEACVSVEFHHEGTSKWISVDVFLCPSEMSFNCYGEVCVWMEEPRVRKQLKEAGFPA